MKELTVNVQRFLGVLNYKYIFIENIFMQMTLPPKQKQNNSEKQTMSTSQYFLNPILSLQSDIYWLGRRLTKKQNNPIFPYLMHDHGF